MTEGKINRTRTAYHCRKTYKAWDSSDSQVAAFLLLYVSGAFDNISHASCFQNARLPENSTVTADEREKGVVDVEDLAMISRPNLTMTTKHTHSRYRIQLNPSARLRQVVLIGGLQIELTNEFAKRCLDTKDM